MKFATINEIRLVFDQHENSRDEWETFSRICKKHGGRYTGRSGRGPTSIPPGYLWNSYEQHLAYACKEELAAINSA